MENGLNILLYYFPSKEVLDFMLNDLFVEFKELIDESLIYSVDNKKDSVRNQNRNKVEDIIVKFFDVSAYYICAWFIVSCCWPAKLTI